MPVKRKRRQGQPHKVLHLTTYQRLEEYLGAFASGHFHLLILVGAGGLAKSRSVRAVLDSKACWIEGNATPFGMYVKLYRHAVGHPARVHDQEPGRHHLQRLEVAGTVPPLLRAVDPPVFLRSDR